jgi:mRNA interferase MazF
MSIKRGDLFWVNLDPARGSEQAGRRPVVVIQNNIGNEAAATTIIAPLTTKDFSKEYPATLHINVGKDFRQQNIGSRLMSAYLDYLSKEKVTGVSLATMSDKAAGFFKKQGFNLLHTGKRSYLRYLLHEDLPIYIFGKRLL